MGIEFVPDPAGDPNHLKADGTKTPFTRSTNSDQGRLWPQEVLQQPKKEMQTPKSPPSKNDEPWWDR